MLGTNSEKVIEISYAVGVIGKRKGRVPGELGGRSCIRGSDFQSWARHMTLGEAMRGKKRAESVDLLSRERRCRRPSREDQADFLHRVMTASNPKSNLPPPYQMGCKSFIIPYPIQLSLSTSHLTG